MLHVVLDCVDPEGLAGFWCEALGYRRSGLGGAFVILEPIEPPGPPFLLQRVREPKRARTACTWISKPRTCADARRDRRVGSGRGGRTDPRRDGQSRVGCRATVPGRHGGRRRPVRRAPAAAGDRAAHRYRHRRRAAHTTGSPRTSRTTGSRSSPCGQPARRRCRRDPARERRPLVRVLVGGATETPEPRGRVLVHEDPLRLEENERHANQ
jgi:hypothetical protein